MSTSAVELESLVIPIFVPQRSSAIVYREDCNKYYRSKKQIAVIKLDQNISTNIYDAAMEFFVDLRLISVFGVLCGYSLEG
jgi:hypothetical protein